MIQHRTISRRAATGTWEACYTPGRRRSKHENSENSAMYGLLAIVAILALLLVVVTSKPALSQGVQLVKVDVTTVGKGYRAAKLESRRAERNGTAAIRRSTASTPAKLACATTSARC